MSRLAVLSLIAAVAFAAACGGAAPGSDAADAGSGPAAGTIAVKPVVTTGKPQTASLPAQAGLSYRWTARNATITSGADGASITFSPGSPFDLTLSCTVRSVTGASAQVDANVRVVPLPRAPAIRAAPFALVGSIGAGAVIVDPAPLFTYRWSIAGAELAGGGQSATGTGVSFVPSVSARATTFRSTPTFGTACLPR